ncbi:MAG: HDOD domain-containing protein [Deltaproteobacteria bacterium]|nr:HDOD domain-containing protein [Deltaproteobacteria bacterium]
MTAKTDPEYGKGVAKVGEGDPLSPILAEIRLGVKTAVSKEDFEIPLLPHVASQVLQMANNPKAGIPEIENLVKQDQVIAAKIIKTANSPFYRGLSNIVSLRDAMGRMGLKALKDIVFSLSIHSKVFKIKSFEPVLDSIWDHSVACAAICQHIAKKKGMDAEHAFLAGLVHDIGKPVLVQVVSEFEEKQRKMMIEKMRAQKKTFDPKDWKIDKLRDMLLPIIFDEYHGIVGALVATKWKLPGTLSEVIRFHHDYAQAKEGQKMAALVHAANIFCHHFGLGHEAKPVDLTQQKAFFDLGFTIDQIKVLEKEIPEIAKSLMGSL